MATVERPYKIDATQIRLWLDCRESYRLSYVESLRPRKPLIHREFGIGFHKGVEVFWGGGDYSAALAAASQYVQLIDETGLSVKERQKWQEMVRYMPDLLAVYFDNVEYAPDANLLVEKEWNVLFANPETPVDDVAAVLCGRIDRFTKQHALIDVKTDSGIGSAEEFRQKWLRDVGLALYDWYLCEVGTPPQMVAIERCIKPYRERPARYEYVELPEITSSGYRERFRQQLGLILADMVHYLDNYQDMKPWPMNSNHSCTTKYGPCDFLEGCNKGWSQRTLEKFKPREEHLAVRGGLR